MLSKISTIMLRKLKLRQKNGFLIKKKQRIFYLSLKEYN